MSWLLAEFRTAPDRIDLDRSDVNALADIHFDSPRHQSTTERHYLAAGGLAETCLHGSSIVEGISCEWIVLGMAFKHIDGHAVLCDASFWERMLSAHRPDVNSIDGHFVVVRWSASHVECLNDQLGMRTMHVALTSYGCVISTRLDWIARRIGSSTINYSSFGAHWLLTNQMSSDGLLSGIDRLGQGGRFELTKASSTLVEQPWSPDWNVTTDPIAILESMMHPRGLDRIVSLGLSGGLDSRVLLALLLSDNSRPVSTHVIGPPDDPDVEVSKLIAKREAPDQLHLNDGFATVDSSIAMLREYVGWSCAIEPASAVTKLQYYPYLESIGKAIVDGGLGEIARRSYLKRLLIRGRSALRSGDPEAMYPFVHIHRADVFNDDVARIMRRGAVEQISSMRAQMPPIGEIGDENFVDLMAVRTRFPFFAGLEQARSDASVMCYMPFAQPSFLQSIMPQRELRRAGRMFRSIIHERAPQLTRYPLVKGGVAIPYSAPPLVAVAWARASNRIGARKRDNIHARFLDHIATFVRDTATSDGVRHFDGYDARKVQSLVDRFYRGERRLAVDINWWLSFEVWRQGSIYGVKSE